jgi:hypothetical protein
MGYFLINIRRYLDKEKFGLSVPERPVAAMGGAKLVGIGNKENSDSC